MIHAFQPVAGHPDDDECTYRSERDIERGSFDSYCGRPEADHASSGRTPPLGEHGRAFGERLASDPNLSERVRRAAREVLDEDERICRTCHRDPADARHDAVQAFLLGVCVTLVAFVLLGLAGAFS